MTWFVVGDCICLTWNVRRRFYTEDIPEIQLIKISILFLTTRKTSKIALITAIPGIATPNVKHKTELVTGKRKNVRLSFSTDTLSKWGRADVESHNHTVYWAVHRSIKPVGSFASVGMKWRMHKACLRHNCLSHDHPFKLTRICLETRS